MTWISKHWQLVIAVGAIIVVIGTYFSSQQDSKQKDLIQELSTKSLELSNKIHALDTLNISIGRRVESLTNQNNISAAQNLAITSQAKDLIYAVKFLTIESKELSAKIDKRATIEAEQNKLSGALELVFHPPIPNESQIKVKFAGNTFSRDETNMANDFISGKNLLTWDMKGGHFNLYVQLFDVTNGDLLLEIMDSKWKINPMFKNKVNYDNKGFEVIDNKDNVLFSVDIMPDNSVSIQAVLPREGGYFALGRDEFNFFKTFDMNDGAYRNARIYLRKLFVYSGSDYLHKRL